MGIFISNRLRPGVLVFAAMSFGVDASEYNFTPLKSEQRKVESGASAGQSASEASEDGHGGLLGVGKTSPSSVPNYGQLGAQGPDDVLEGLSISADGKLVGDGVVQTIQRPRGTSFPNVYHNGKPAGVSLHNSAARLRACGSGNPVLGSPMHYAPHIIVCRDGRVLVNGTFDTPTSAEKGHRDWVVNVMFESAYDEDKDTDCEAKKRYQYRHCYEALTDAQIQRGSKVLDLLSQKYEIPKKLALGVENNDQYYDRRTRILPRKLRPKSDDGLLTKSSSDSSVKGILPSFWAQSPSYSDAAREGPDRTGQDTKNHDDGPTLEEMRRLGVVQ